MQLDAALEQTGTRFRLFAQARYLPAFSQPETVFVSTPPDRVQPGPTDDRMFVVNAVNKRPYSRSGPSPQWQGQQRDPIKPGADGHFDHIGVDSPDFSCATMYASVRRALDIWQDYFGRRIEWFFRNDFARLELIPLIEWDNAQSGYGFLEFGFGRLQGGGIDHRTPYCQNFDVLVHELGHNILFSEVGVPDSDASATDEYGGFQESGGDLTAIVACLHFNSVVDHILTNSKGNLFTVNELSRLGELPDGREIRAAFNYEKMSTVSTEPHALSLPLTGAIFDIFVDVFQKELVKRSLITVDLAKRSTHGAAPNSDLPAIQAAFAHAYNGHEAEFKTALLTARDYLGKLLATTWSTLSPNFLTYHKVALAIMDTDQELTHGMNQTNIRECFAWREITTPNPMFMLRRITDCGIAEDRIHHQQYPLRPTAGFDSYFDVPAFVEDQENGAESAYKKRAKSKR